MTTQTNEPIERFSRAVVDLGSLLSEVTMRRGDEYASNEVRDWLDKDATPLAWAEPYPHVTDDEWFFISTLYGEMTMDAQRTHIRKFFPALFVGSAARDMRNFHPGLAGFEGLRSGWMRTRLCKMGAILRERGVTMAAYAQHLRVLEKEASPENPMPALDAIRQDHAATGWKTLSVFVRDCIGGNCFPIDSRVQKVLMQHGLPVDEKALVGFALVLDLNPRPLARLFFEAGGQIGEQTSTNAPTAAAPEIKQPMSVPDTGIKEFIK